MMARFKIPRLSTILSINKNVTYNSVRFGSVTSKKLVHSEFGDPLKVISMQQEVLAGVESGHVLVKILAAPVNPADINTIEGKYPFKPTFPAVGGNEAVAEVIEVGSGVTGLSIGDRVIPGIIGLGTWRTFATFPSTNLIKVPKELGLIEAATLTVNPCTAYRMIKDFRTLKQGDTLIQNGANSACGQNVIQICKAWGINSVNIVRNRPDIDTLKEYLTGLGATAVLTEEELRTTDIFKSGRLARPKLALNCVGGKSATEVMRQLDHAGAIVTYGGMSREPVIIPTAALIFKDISVVGYWMTHWAREQPPEKRSEMFLDVVDLMLKGQLKAPMCKTVDFDSYAEALQNCISVKGFTGNKYILKIAE